MKLSLSQQQRANLRVLSLLSSVTFLILLVSSIFQGFQDCRRERDLPQNVLWYVLFHSVIDFRTDPIALVFVSHDERLAFRYNLRNKVCTVCDAAQARATNGWQLPKMGVYPFPIPTPVAVPELTNSTACCAPRFAHVSDVLPAAMDVTVRRRGLIPVLKMLLGYGLGYQMAQERPSLTSVEDWTKSPGNLSEYECYMFCCSLLKVDWLQYADRMQIKTETISDSKLAAVLKLSQTDNTNSLPYTNSLVYLRPFYENQLHRFTADARPQAVAYARKIFHSQIQKGYLDSSNDDEVKQLAAREIWSAFINNQFDSILIIRRTLIEMFSEGKPPTNDA
ncbi:MAG: hypothetical protein WCL11_11060 [Verrucomicrobiota bacterium]